MSLKRRLERLESQEEPGAPTGRLPYTPADWTDDELEVFCSSPTSELDEKARRTDWGPPESLFDGMADAQLEAFAKGDITAW